MSNKEMEFIEFQRTNKKTPNRRRLGFPSNRVGGEARLPDSRVITQPLRRAVRWSDPFLGLHFGEHPRYVENRGIDLHRLAKEKGLEGIIAKRKTSTYRPEKRSPDWLKIKARPQQEFVVCGFTEGKGSRKHFGALLLGAYRNGRLRYFGHSGTGFSEKGLQEAIDRLTPLFIDESPVENPPKVPERIQWVQPKLVCEVAYAEWNGRRLTISAAHQGLHCGSGSLWEQRRKGPIARCLYRSKIPPSLDRQANAEHMNR